MKKKLMLCIPVVALGLLTSGCGNTKVLECTMTDDSTDGMEMLETIKATYKKDALTNVTMNMKITVDEELEEYMDELSDSLTSEFSSLEDKEGVKVTAETDENVLDFNIEADLTKMDDEAKEELDMDDETETYEEAKKYFEEEGYTCK